jgi:integrase
LRSLRPAQIKGYFLERADKLSGATLQAHFVILQSALKSAIRNGCLAKNPCEMVDGRPKAKDPEEDAKENCLTLAEAQSLLSAAKATGPQAAALFQLAIDAGARRGELLGLKWDDVNLDAGKIRIDRTLLKSRDVPVFGPPKTKSGRRTIDINEESVRLLRAHKAAQAELKMQNRRIYNDHNLVFAREWADTRNCETLGLPLNGDDLSHRSFQKLVKQAGIKHHVTFHGLRHTCATLLLSSGEPVHEVSKRLGHAHASMTLDIYAHSMPSNQQGMARRFGTLLASGI